MNKVIINIVNDISKICRDYADYTDKIMRNKNKCMDLSFYLYIYI